MSMDVNESPLRTFDPNNLDRDELEDLLPNQAILNAAAERGIGSLEDVVPGAELLDLEPHLYAGEDSNSSAVAEEEESAWE
jgi:hypothetical protein